MVDPEDLRIQVGVADDPVEPVSEALGTDTDASRALRLSTDPETYLTVDGGLWALTEQDGDVLEGPCERDNVLAGLARADELEVVDYDDTPLTGEVRGRA